MILELCGFFGNLFLSICGIPLLIDTLKGKSFTSWKFLLVWFFGEILAIIFAIAKDYSYFIIGNYALSIILIVSIFVAQLMKRRNDVIQ